MGYNVDYWRCFTPVLKMFTSMPCNDFFIRLLILAKCGVVVTMQHVERLINGVE